MIHRIIAWCAGNRLATLLVVALGAAAGMLSLRASALDALPDLSDVQVIVYTEWTGRSPDLVEDNITYPVIRSLLGSARVSAVRGQTMFGASFVTVIFEEHTDLYWARSRVLEKLATLAPELPVGVTPTLGPDATGVGWVFEYALVDRTGKTDLTGLESLQEWTLRYALQGIAGVAEVASVGGFVKEYQVDVDPDRLAAFHVSLVQVADALRASNADVGGRILEVGGTEQYVRGRGYVKKVQDLEEVVLATHQGTPVRVADVAHVRLGPAERRGLADLDGEGEVVGGAVIVRPGVNTLAVIEAVKTRIQELRASLPPGVEVVTTYDRSQLVNRSIATLRRTLLEELLVVGLVILVFLLHLRSTLVPMLVLPVAILLAFIPMHWLGLTTNIMSLGGIAIAVGAMVDAAIVVVENVHKRLEAWQAAGSPGSRPEVVTGALQEVGRPIFFSLLVITVGFLPVFMLEGAEGRLFAPLAFTKTFAMAFAALLTVTLVPAIAATFIRGRLRTEAQNPLARALTRAYAPVCRLALRFPKTLVAVSVLLVVVTLPVARSLGSEFMPPLNEGSILYMPISVPGMSDASASDVLQRMDRVLKSFPEVERVFGKAGRFQTATDPAPLSMFETMVTLRPMESWPSGRSWEQLVTALDERMQFPGMPNVWWMPIQTRTEMLATGIRTPLGIQVLGADLQVIDRLGREIETALLTVPGTRSVFSERASGGYFLDFDVDRAGATRYGLNVREVEESLEMAVGGRLVTTTVEGRERYPVTLRYARDFRSDPQSIRRVRVQTPGGAQVSLGELGSLHWRTGPSMIRDEGGSLAEYVFVDTARSLGDYVQDAKRAVARVALPAGYRVEWVGQYKYLERAKERLAVVIPITLVLIFLLLYLNAGNAGEALLVMLAVPFSLVGAFWLLWFLGYNLSVAVWVGLIALAGLDAETGIVMLLYLNLAWKELRPATREAARQAVFAGAVKRIRPKMMTVVAILAGLVPILWATGTGADVMKRIAAPMVGGVITSALLELAVYPALYFLWRARGLAEQTATEPSAPGLA